MMRLVVLMMVCAMCLGCGRSADNSAGFNQALQDMENGVKPARDVRSEEYRQGYREAVEAVEGGLRRNQEHAADQKRVQQLHERVPRKK
jgi:hypothetical protein